MTFQVASVNSAGIVLASDQREVDENGFATTSLVNKIFVSPNQRVSWMFSGTATAHLAAFKLLLRLSKGEDNNISSLADLETVMLECANDAHKEKEAKTTLRESMIGALADSATYQILDIDIGPTSMSQKYSDKCIRGDHSNVAAFLVEHNWKPKSSLAELILLASHTIFTASTHNDKYVQGLNLVYWKRGSAGFVPLTPEHINNLELISSEIDGIFPAGLKSRAEAYALPSSLGSFLSAI